MSKFNKGLNNSNSVSMSTLKSKSPIYLTAAALSIFPINPLLLSNNQSLLREEYRINEGDDNNNNNCAKHSALSRYKFVRRKKPQDQAILCHMDGNGRNNNNIVRLTTSESDEESPILTSRFFPFVERRQQSPCSYSNNNNDINRHQLSRPSESQTSQQTSSRLTNNINAATTTGDERPIMSRASNSRSTLTPDYLSQSEQLLPQSEQLLPPNAQLLPPVYGSDLVYLRITRLFELLQNIPTISSNNNQLWRSDSPPPPSYEVSLEESLSPVGLPSYDECEQMEKGKEQASLSTEHMNATPSYEEPMNTPEHMNVVAPIIDNSTCQPIIDNSTCQPIIDNSTCQPIIDNTTCRSTRAPAQSNEELMNTPLSPPNMLRDRTRPIDMRGSPPSYQETINTRPRQSNMLRNRRGNNSTSIQQAGHTITVQPRRNDLLNSTWEDTLSSGSSDSEDEYENKWHSCITSPFRKAYRRAKRWKRNIETTPVASRANNRGNLREGNWFVRKARNIRNCLRNKFPNQ